MKKIKKLSILALAVITALAMTGISASAVSSDLYGSCHFDGSSIVADFDSGQIAQAVTDLQPGDDVSFTVEYTNEYEESTDWYMSNEVIRTLEKANESKRVAGTGTAENGGYSYELVHEDKDGKENVLFSSDEVGGEAKPADMEGLEQATNALDEWFYIQTLGKGESGTVRLNVALDGETEVNDYMDTSGSVMVKFAVELTPKNVEKSKKKYGGKGVTTGDRANLMPWIIAMLAAGILLLLLALRSRRKDRQMQTGGDE